MKETTGLLSVLLKQCLVQTFSFKAFQESSYGTRRAKILNRRQNGLTPSFIIRVVKRVPRLVLTPLFVL